jgi:hypothetical protein
MKAKLTVLALALIPLISSAQLTQEQFTLNKEGKYHYSKTVKIGGATASALIIKAKKFLEDFTGNFEGTTWKQIKGTNTIVAAFNITDPRSITVSIGIAISNGQYTYDIRDIEFYYHGDQQVETVFSNKKEVFDEIRKDLLIGLSKLAISIEEGIK